MSDVSREGEVPMLASLQIDPGYLEFDPGKTEYTVQLGEDVSKLLVRARTAGDDQTYTVSGNSALRKGSNEVVITVENREGEKTVYRIHVTVGEEESVFSEQTETTAAVPALGFLEHITTGNNRYVTIGICGCTVFALILWCIFAVKRLRAKRFEKQLAAQREEERRQRAKRYEQARAQEEELLRQIERLKKKSRTYIPQQEGLRVIQLDDDDEYEDEEEMLDYEDYEDDEYEEEEDGDYEDGDYDSDEDL